MKLTINFLYIISVYIIYSLIFAFDPAEAELYYHFNAEKESAHENIRAEKESAHENIRLANYNISWFGSSSIPNNQKIKIYRNNKIYWKSYRKIYRRKDNDFQDLKKIIKQLGADIVALQEINNIQALSKIFDSKDYNFILANGSNPQKTGFAIAKHFKYKRNSDLDDLAYLPEYPDSLLRRATDITLYLKNDQQIRLLSIHLKSGCYSLRTIPEKHECDILQKQFEILTKWVEKQLLKGENFIIMGDFNRRLFDLDPFIISFQDLVEQHNSKTSLSRKLKKYGKLILPSIQTNPLCWKRRYVGFIDHFIIGLRTNTRLSINSFGEYLYQEPKSFNRDSRKLSDHCPVFIDFSSTVK